MLVIIVCQIGPAVWPPNAAPGRRWPLPTLCPFRDLFGIVGCPT